VEAVVTDPGGVEHAGRGAGKGAGKEPAGGGDGAPGWWRGRSPGRRRRVLLDLRAAGPVVLAFCFALGAHVYFSLPGEPGVPSLAFGLALSLALLAGLRRLPSQAAALFGAMLVAGALGLAHAKATAARTATVMITAETGPLQLEGWVRQVEGGRNGPRLRIEVHAMQGMDAERIPRLVRVTHPLSLAVGPGRFVRCRVVLRPPPAPAMPGDYDFRRQAFFEGLGAVGYVQGRCRGGSLGAPPRLMAGAGLWLDGQRRRLAAHVREAAGERAGGFAAALVSGDRSHMAQEDQEALRASGLAHLLAISGLHLAIVCGLVYLIVRRSLALVEPLALRIAVQKPAAAAALLAGGVYLLLSGASVSTQRAFIMAAIFFGAILFDRPGFSLRSFAVAMVAVVLIDPVSVTSPGFQMSFAATGALIATYEAMTRRRADDPLPMRRGRVYSAAESLVVTSVVASFATAPFALYHFDRVAGAGLIANLAAMPIVSFLSAPAAGLALVLAPLGLGDIGLRLFGLTLEWVLAVAHWSAALPGQAVMPAWPMPASAFVLLVGALAGWILLAGWLRWLSAVALTVAAGLAWITVKGADLHWGADGDIYVAGPDGVLRVAVIDGDGLGPLRYSDLATRASCQTGACLFPSHRGSVEISWQNGEPQACLRAGERLAGPCDRRLGWREAEAAGGLSVHLGRAGTGPGPCRERPWITCVSDRP